MSFSIIEGQVDVKPIILKIHTQATIAPNSDSLFVLDYTKQSKLIFLGIKALSGNFSYQVKIYSNVNKAFNSVVLVAESQNESEMVFSNLSIPVYTSTGKLYFEILHTQNQNEDFEIVVFGEVVKAISL